MFNFGVEYCICPFDLLLLILMNRVMVFENWDLLQFKLCLISYYLMNHLHLMALCKNTLGLY